MMKLLVLVNSCKSKFPLVLRLQKLFGFFPIFWNIIWEGRLQLLRHPVEQKQYSSLYYPNLALSLAIQRCDHGMSCSEDAHCIMYSALNLKLLISLPLSGKSSQTASCSQKMWVCTQIGTVKVCTSNLPQVILLLISLANLQGYHFFICVEFSYSTLVF